MPKKLKKTSTKDSVKKQEKLLKKPNLEEFLKQASNWHDKWGALCTPPFNDKSVYLDYQKMFYIQNIQDLSGAEYNMLVQKQTKDVVSRFNKILDKHNKK